MELVVTPADATRRSATRDAEIAPKAAREGAYSVGLRILVDEHHRPHRSGEDPEPDDQAQAGAGELVGGGDHEHDRPESDHQGRAMTLVERQVRVAVLEIEPVAGV